MGELSGFPARRPPGGGSGASSHFVGPQKRAGAAAWVGAVWLEPVAAELARGPVCTGTARSPGGGERRAGAPGALLHLHVDRSYSSGVTCCASFLSAEWGSSLLSRPRFLRRLRSLLF